MGDEISEGRGRYSYGPRYQGLLVQEWFDDGEPAAFHILAAGDDLEQVEAACTEDANELARSGVAGVLEVQDVAATLAAGRFVRAREAALAN